MSIVHVAVAVIVNAAQQVLIAQRPQHVHQGGLWEFPGGKVEADENILVALQREIREELGVIIQSAEPLIKVRHDYSDKSVLLDVWRVLSFEGIPHGAEGQLVNWLDISELNPAHFPAANKTIIDALIKPDKMLITGAFSDVSDFRKKLHISLEKNLKLVQLRCKQYCRDSDYLDIVHVAQSLCNHYGAELLLNNDESLARQLGVGLHLSSQIMMQHQIRPVSNQQLLSVSCHNQQELRLAELIGADIILLSPVKETSSHPGVPGIGWDKFSDLVAQVDPPVYALGGMQAEDIAIARQHGAQGVAAITAWWGKA